MQLSPQELESKIEARVRTIRILWFALFLSIVLYFAFGFFVGRAANSKPDSTLSLTLLGIGVLTTIASFPIKMKFLSRSVEQQSVDTVQQGYIIAWALTESAALLGLLDFFATSDRYYYVLFLIAGIGQLLHFPRREHVLAASFKNPSV